MTNITLPDFDSNRRDSDRRLHFRGVRNDDRYDGIGAEFAAARQQAGLDIIQIAQRLRIRREHLTAIEQGRFDDLPALAYAIGFVRSYAEFLGLDSSAAVQAYKLETESGAHREPLVFPTAELIDRMPRGWLVGMSAVLAAVVFGAWYYSENSGRVSVNAVPPAPAPAASADVPSSPRPEIAVTALPSLSDVPAAVPEAVLSDSAADLDPAIGRILGVIPAPPNLPADVAAAEAAPAPAASVAAVPLAQPVVAVEAAPEPAASVAAVPLAQPVAAAVESPVPSSLAAPAPSPESQVAAAAPSAPEPTASATASPSLPAPVQPVVAVAEPPVTAAPVALAPGQTTVVPDEGPVATAPVALASGQTTAAPDEGLVVAALPEPAASPAQPAVAAARVAVPSAVPDDVAALPGGREPQVYGAVDGEARVVIAAREDSWVQITGAAGELLLTRILRSGDRYLAPLREDLVLMTGNAGALEITVDGTVVPPLGPLGTVRRHVSLAPDRLLAGTAVER